MPDCLLGLPLEEAEKRLLARGITPEITVSRAPRRPDGTGAFRVVRVLDGGRRLTVCAFETAIKEQRE